jgi:serine/threonine protein kinase
MPSREQDIFATALELPPAERDAYLATACGDDTALRARLESLLRAAAGAGGFLGGEGDAEPDEDEDGRIGAYRLVEKLGDGGFGIVYRAEQERPVRRTVALKILKLGMDTRAIVARFAAERQALALMDHPHIARVFDGGATPAGRPFFVMEFVAGEPVTTFARERKLSVPERLRIFLQICRAVHHAHQKGVIHRDLKPSNLLVATSDGRPHAKVIDFGVAKALHEPLTEHTVHSRVQRFLGTPAYMSPEQVTLGGIDVDTRADVFALGAVLHELLVDSPPLEARRLATLGYAEVERVVREAHFPAPSRRLAALAPAERAAIAAARRTTPARLAAELRGDLDQIVLKCLAADRTQRYDSAEDLARDLERHLRHEPVQARPATLGYRARRFVRRHTRAVAAGAVAVLVLAGLIGYHTQRLAVERDRAVRAARRASAMSELLTLHLSVADPFKVFGEKEHHETLARVRRDFADDPATQVEVLGTAAHTLLRGGRRQEAEGLLRSAVAAARDLSRPTKAFAEVLADLAVIHRERGDFPGAIAQLEQLRQLQRALGAEVDAEQLATTCVELGRNYMALEQDDRAEVLFREALDLRVAALGPEHGNVSGALGDLAQAEWYLGKLEAAEQHCREASEMFRRVVSPEHPNVASSWVALGRILLDRGDLEGAEKYHTDASALFTRLLGPRHWRTAGARVQLGATWGRQGRADDAARELRDALAILSEDPRNNPTQIASAEIELARVTLARGEAPAEAEKLLRSALTKQLARYPAGGWRVAATRSLLAEALLQQLRWSEAEPLLVAAHEVLPDLPGPRGGETRPTRERLARLYLAQGQTEQAARFGPTPR